MSEYAKGFDVGVETGKSFERARTIMLLRNTMCPEYEKTSECSHSHMECAQTDVLIDLIAMAN